ncbi:MAG: rhodanese-like domain-containing protein [Kofleriaceae bacterium]|nr:rhodanese-like domain-containing protein [Kofleriaceae bacterium]MCB9574321.1 rhodanese-like domain-containing protein [Kofleriaceae bacterium]
MHDRARPAVEGTHRDVDPAQVWEHRGAVVLIDVREPGEYTGELGHVPGATLVPLSMVGSEAPRWDADAEIVLICRSGARSGRAAGSLARAGFTRVMNMTGGMLAWNAAQLPVER